MSDRDVTRDLMERLERHYIPKTEQAGAMPGGVFVGECGVNGQTGSRCDALYVGFTSASGRILIGHEVKASRSDWRRELAKVGKADSWADQCHRWYLVAPSTDVIPIEEVPHGWGLMIPATRGSKMQVVVRPETHADRHPEWWAVRSIMARLDTLRAQREVDMMGTLRDEAERQARARIAREQERAGHTTLTPAQRTALAFVERLEERTGLKVDGGWERSLTPEVAAAALSLTRLPSRHYSSEQMRDVARRTVEVLDEFDKAMTEVQGILTPPPERTT